MVHIPPQAVFHGVINAPSRHHGDNPHNQVNCDRRLMDAGHQLCIGGNKHRRQLRQLHRQLLKQLRVMITVVITAMTMITTMTMITVMIMIMVMMIPVIMMVLMMVVPMTVETDVWMMGY